jgi:DNA-binding MarR family transcriptional regulator
VSWTDKAGSVQAMPAEDPALTIAIASMARMFEVVLEQHSLTIQKYRVLKYLALSSVTSSDLAYQLTVSRPTVTRLVDGLVEMDLVRRSMDEADGRRSTLELTPVGRRRLADADVGLLESLERVASQLPIREQRTAKRGLHLWARAMTVYWAKTHPNAAISPLRRHLGTDPERVRNETETRR